MTDPVHNLGHGSHDVTRRQYRPINQNDWNLQESSRFELRLGTASAGVLGDDDLDPVVGQKLQVLRLGKGATRDHRFCVGQRQMAVGRIDQSQKIVVLRLGSKKRERLLADSKKDARRSIGQRPDSGFGVWDMLPVVARSRDPGRPFQHQKRDADAIACGQGILAHPGRERVGCIDDMGNSFGFEPCNKSVHTTKATDTHRQGLGNWRLGSPCIGKDGVNFRVGQRASQHRGFGGSAQQQDTRHV